MSIKGVEDDSKLTGTPASVPVVRAGWKGKAPVVASYSDSDPVDQWLAISTSDDLVYDPAPIAVYVGTGGHVALSDADGDIAIFKNVPNGTILPLQPTKIRATGTTAADIVLLFRSDI